MVHYPAIAGKMLPGDVGDLQVESIAGTNLKDVTAKTQELEKQGAKRLILDLRHCATGTPEQGIALANLFLDKGLITYTQGQKSPRQDIEAAAAKQISKLPLAVITNRGTADGCEIAAAALLDDKRAEVIGERTYGDAAIRKAVTMDDGSAVILSVAKYYSPSGKAIQDTGVAPSVPMVENEPAPEADDDNPTPDTPPANSGDDPLLKKAIEVLTSGKPAAVAQKPAAEDPEGRRLAPAPEVRHPPQKDPPPR
jgi:carboxyl-terminal processing protease